MGWGYAVLSNFDLTGGIQTFQINAMSIKFLNKDYFIANQQSEPIKDLLI